MTLHQYIRESECRFACADCGLPEASEIHESPEQILDRLAERLGCEPRQVADRVIRMLEERG